MTNARTQLAEGILVSGRDGFLIARITTCDKWLLGTSHGFCCVSDAERLTAALEREMIATGHHHVIMDARSHASGSRAASEVVWEWVARSDRLRSMALVNNSENLALAIRMKTLASSIKKVRPFQTLVAAELWMDERVRLTT